MTTTVTAMKRLLSLITFALVLPALHVRASTDSAAMSYERALYPAGISPRMSLLTDEEVRPSFVLHSTAKLPESDRQVVVYSERIDKDLPYDKLYWTYVATVEPAGDELRVLDRQEVTDELPVEMAFPGNVEEVRALVTSMPQLTATVAVVELWAILHGTGFISGTTHLLFTIDAAGKLVPRLTLEDTYSSARLNPPFRDGAVARIFFGTASQTDGEIVVERREARWTESASRKSGKAACGSRQFTTYRFNGRSYEARPSVEPLSSSLYSILPRLPMLETKTCAN